MSKNVELANVIKNFINKHWANTNQVEWPKFDFNITGVSQIEIKEDSLNKISNIWTFKGSALITIE
ncbi:MAG: hypothetical protein K2H97_03215, partial [Prevotella sp.]|nr:hypothetical protein [Prevotella sp.]